MNEKIIFAGFGGQGIILAGKLVCIAAMNEGKYVSHIPSYGAEMRGGTANCAVVIATEEIPSPMVFNPTVCVALNLPSLKKFESRLSAGGVLIYNSSLIENGPQRNDIVAIPVKANELAEQAGSYKAANMVAIGALLKANMQIASLQAVKDALSQAVSKRNLSFNDINKKALTLGFESVKTALH
ncbi:MAG: 2-oxoacid:acceptor oxidoreductase family protein [Spirochaetales bacterium]|nr:2-oxoacid:acceptor oxidoreductase family protein [Spirochaetales bacterium]